MIIEYDIHCFERTLTIKFPDKYKNLKDEFLQLLNDAYLEWHDAENIEDPNERAVVQDSCLEEYMMYCLSVYYPEWEEWNSIYYGDDEEEKAVETVPTINPELLAKRKLAQDLRGAELIID